MKSRIAEKNSESLKQQYSKNPGSLIFSRLADTYRKEGDIGQAVELCKQGLQDHPEYITGRIILGRCYIEQEDIENAVEEFTNVCKYDRHNQVAIKMLADLFVKQEKLHVAGDLYRILLKMDPFDQSFKILASRFDTTGKTDLFDVLDIQSETTTSEFSNTSSSPLSVSIEKQFTSEPLDTSIDGSFSEPLSDEPVEDVLASLSMDDYNPLPKEDSSQISGEDIDSRMEALFGEEPGQPQIDNPINSIDSIGSVGINSKSAAPESVSGTDISSRIDELFDIPPSNRGEQPPEVVGGFNEPIYGTTENIDLGNDATMVPESDVEGPDLPGAFNFPSGEQTTSYVSDLQDGGNSLSENISDSLPNDYDVNSLEKQVADNLDITSDEFEETLQFDRSMLSRFNDEPDYEELTSTSPFVSTQDSEVAGGQAGLEYTTDYTDSIQEQSDSDLQGDDRDGASLQYQSLNLPGEPAVSPEAELNSIGDGIMDNIFTNEAKLSENEIEQPDFVMDDIADSEDGAIFDSDQLGDRLDLMLPGEDDSSKSAGNVIELTTSDDSSPADTLDDLVSMSTIGDLIDPVENSLNTPFRQENEGLGFIGEQEPLDSVSSTQKNTNGNELENNENVNNLESDNNSLITSEQFGDQFDTLFSNDSRDSRQTKSDEGVASANSDPIDNIQEYPGKMDGGSDEMLLADDTSQATEGFDNVTTSFLGDEGADCPLPTGDDVGDRLESHLSFGNSQSKPEELRTSGISDHIPEIPDEESSGSEFRDLSAFLDENYSTTEMNVIATDEGENSDPSLVVDLVNDSNDELPDENQLEQDSEIIKPDFPDIIEDASSSGDDIGFDSIEDAPLHQKTEMSMQDGRSFSNLIEDSADGVQGGFETILELLADSESEEVNIDPDDMVVSDMDVLVVEPQEDQMTGDDVANKIQDILDESEQTGSVSSLEVSEDALGLVEDTGAQMYSDTTDFNVIPAENGSSDLFDQLTLLDDGSGNIEKRDNIDLATSSMELQMDELDLQDGSLLNDEVSETLIIPNLEQVIVNEANEINLDDGNLEECVDQVTLIDKMDDGVMSEVDIISGDRMLDSDMRTNVGNMNSNEIPVISGEDVEERLEEFFGDDILGVTANEVIPEDDDCEETIIQDFYTVTGENTATASGDEDLVGVENVEVDQGVEFIDEDEDAGVVSKPVSIIEPDSGSETVETFHAATLFEEESVFNQVDPADTTVLPITKRKSNDSKPTVYEQESSLTEPEIDLRDKPYAIPDHVLTPTLADIYYQQGQYQLAHQIYSRLLEKEPDNDRLHSRMNEIAAAINAEPLDEVQNQSILKSPALAKKKKQIESKASSTASKSDPRPLAGVRISKKKSTRKKVSRKKS